MCGGDRRPGVVVDGDFAGEDEIDDPVGEVTGDERASRLTYVGAGAAPSAGPTAGILNWRSYVVERWPGGIDLGAWGLRRAHGGHELSVHAVGRAWDWRYAGPGPGRGAAEDVMAFAVAHRELLGLQAIVDHAGGRAWRCSRPVGGAGWARQRSGGSMGAPWAQWLHFEVHPASPLHRRTARDVLAAGGVDPCLDDRPATPTAALPLSPLRLGDHGAPVAHLQQVLRFWDLYGGAIDGLFGEDTAAAVRSWQRALRCVGVEAADGVYDARTQAAAALSYGVLLAPPG